MARWTDVADWIGPTPNRRVNGITAHRGLILHIQEGSEQGTEAWQRNPASQISSHFLAPKVGRPRQMVDTDDVAWTEAAGNDEWLSVEIEGHSGDQLTGDQTAGIAAIYARGMREYGWRLQTADSPTGNGLGWHGMGGNAWGGHLSCPGDPIKNQRPAVLAAAQQHLNPTPATDAEEDTMGASLPPFTINTEGATSLTIPPVEAGAADPRPAWISFCNDTNGADYALRIYTTRGDGTYLPLPGLDKNGVATCKSGKRAGGYNLPAGTCGVTISRQPATTGGQVYTGHLTGVIERGPVVKPAA